MSRAGFAGSPIDMKHRNALLCLGSGLILLAVFLIAASFNAPEEPSRKGTLSAAGGGRPGIERDRRFPNPQREIAGVVPQSVQRMPEGSNEESRVRQIPMGRTTTETGSTARSFRSGEPTEMASTGASKADPGYFEPIVMRIPDDTLAGTGEVEQQVIRDLQDLFAREMEAAPTPDPADPGYLQYWTKIQRGIDDRLRVRLGHEGFLRANILAAQKRAAQAP